MNNIDTIEAKIETISNFTKIIIEQNKQQTNGVIKKNFKEFRDLFVLSLSSIGSFKVIKELKKLVFYLGELMKNISSLKRFSEEDESLYSYFSQVLDWCKYYLEIHRLSRLKKDLSIFSVYFKLLRNLSNFIE